MDRHVGDLGLREDLVGVAVRQAALVARLLQLSGTAGLISAARTLPRDAPRALHHASAVILAHAVLLGGICPRVLDGGGRAVAEGGTVGGGPSPAAQAVGGVALIARQAGANLPADLPRRPLGAEGEVAEHAHGTAEGHDVACCGSARGSVLEGHRVVSVDRGIGDHRHNTPSNRGGVISDDTGGASVNKVVVAHVGHLVGCPIKEVEGKRADTDEHRRIKRRLDIIVNFFFNFVYKSIIFFIFFKLPR